MVTVPPGRKIGRNNYSFVLSFLSCSFGFFVLFPVDLHLRSPSLLVSHFGAPPATTDQEGKGVSSASASAAVLAFAFALEWSGVAAAAQGRRKREGRGTPMAEEKGAAEAEQPWPEEGEKGKGERGKQKQEERETDTTLVRRAVILPVGQIRKSTTAPAAPGAAQHQGGPPGRRKSGLWSTQKCR